ncbi:ATP-dependent DNA helicase PcrA [Candidatus Roizmanbacteria bacterium CG_4_10_14_0_2_um_filter_39_13]|uniref:DNA 3'-5' helicase n=1 Tax=Candidatus Roizmanbacteria bacterium CG_4_10_14_0_2_um_filter_39_13 TaxID=1974825 RepID=A0A2M7U0J6_9BACT|nr:MAG: ATP-dependent DNA helicase PcrA [Candidatus Roizmanbacteria bacterium CG_4_10_14_0_2_um_filter_39_13]
MIDIFKGLNPQQKKAIECIHGPSIVLAGAGSGKTRVLVHKVLNLIENHTVDPRSIVMITFTNKAAREMKDRIAAITENKTTLGYIGTFHSFCAMILRRDGEYIGIPHSYTIYDDGDQQQLLKQILKKKQSKFSPRFFSAKISDAKNQLVSPERFIEIFSFYRSAQVAEVYHQYQKELQKNDALDFDDLLMKVVDLFRMHMPILEKYQNRYQHLLVDEFQDTNVAQYIIAKKLSQIHKNVTVVGDFSQSIYSWRGADIRNLEKFSEDFEGAQKINLEQNYRSTQKILDFAYEIISENQTHPILHLHTDAEPGDDVEIIEVENEEDEATYIAERIQDVANEIDYSEIAVLYRTNAQSRSIEELFLHFGIPYTLIGGTRFYDRKEVKDILCYLRLLLHPDDSVALERVIKLGKRRFQKYKELFLQIKDLVLELPTAELMEMIFDKTEYLGLYDPDVSEDYARLENIKELKSVALTFPNLVDFLEQVALVESEYFEGEKSGKSKDGVRLMTLHQAKGLEFTHVFITGLEEGLLPHSRSIDDIHQLEEERRLFYVGVTRAKKNLVITHAKRRFIFGRRNAAMKSRFIRSGEEDEIEWW